MPTLPTVTVVLGTRPEAIKLGPVVRELMDRGDRCTTRLISTGQHREMLDPMLELFGLTPDRDLDLIRPNQSLEHIVSTVLTRLPENLAELGTDVLVVQGDTSTTFAASLAAFYRDIPVVHVEAGLRTPTPRVPFPEEMNRRLTTRLASLHLAPTERSANALRTEGVPGEDIVLTGNTVVDALAWMRDERRELIEAATPFGLDPSELEGKCLVLVTGHRRESFGEPFRQFCQGLLDCVDDHPDRLLVYPVHLNPKVQSPVFELLDGHPRIRLLKPVSYPSMLWLLERANVVVTDSGGIQEEAPSFGLGVVVTRDVTERVEGVDAGFSVLVGTDASRIVEEVERFLGEPDTQSTENPFGDGQAAQRSVDAILERFG